MARKRTAGASTDEPARKRTTAKSLGLTNDEWDAIKPAPLKKCLKAHARILAKQVDADWHDGYEEQGETVCAWLSDLVKPLNTILKVSIEKGIAFEQCHEALMIIGDSFRDICANPSREDIHDMIGDPRITLSLPWGGEKVFESFEDKCPLKDLCGFVWVHMLRAAAARATVVGEDWLFGAIKDVSDNGIKLESDKNGDTDEGESCDDNNSEKGTDESNNQELLQMKPAVEPLERFVAQKDKWADRYFRIKTFNRRRCIDRRFSGTPERRTRDHHLRDDDDFW